VQLIDSNAIVVARHFNPSIISQLWLVRNQIVGDEEFEAGCVFTDLFVQVRSKKFNLLVTPDQLQFNPQVAEAEQQTITIEKVGRFVSKLPETPYVAAGLNFIWKFEPEQSDTRKLSRSLFFVPDGPLHEFFNTPDARFGGYLSKDVLGCRLKLDVKPAMTQADGTETHVFVLAFNYHMDIGQEGSPVEKVRGLMQNWNAARDLAAQIVRVVGERDRP
jgi:hypothetical protein